MRRKQGISLFAALAVLLVTACGGGDEADDHDMPAMEEPAPAPAAPAPAAPTGAVPAGATAEQVAQGQALFTGQGNCFTCHGMDGKGTQLAPNLTDGTWVNIPTAGMAEIAGVIRAGVPTPREHPAPMPAMGGAQLTDDQVNALAAYVLSLSTGG